MDSLTSGQQGTRCGCAGTPDAPTAVQPRTLPNVALLFAGQGAQHPGMGADLAAQSPAARAVFDACDAVRPGTSATCFSGTAEELKVTANTQPCMFACDLACAEALAARGVVPAQVAGFSLGELAALAFAGVMAPADAFRVVCERARLMDEACAAAPGGMTAVVKLAPKRVEELAAQAGAWPVNYNSPAQTVVAGTADALERLAPLVKEAGGRAMPLAVSGAFHSPLMELAARALADVLAGVAFAPARVPVWANTTGEPYPADSVAARALLAGQAAHPVRWTKTLAGAGSPERMTQSAYRS